MSEPIVFISYFKVRDGKLDGFNHHLCMLFETVKLN